MCLKDPPRDHKTTSTDLSASCSQASEVHVDLNQEEEELEVEEHQTTPSAWREGTLPGEYLMWPFLLLFSCFAFYRAYSSSSLLAPTSATLPVSAPLVRGSDASRLQLLLVGLEGERGRVVWRQGVLWAGDVGAVKDRDTLTTQRKPAIQALVRLNDTQGGLFNATAVQQNLDSVWNGTRFRRKKHVEK